MVALLLYLHSILFYGFNRVILCKYQELIKYVHRFVEL